MQIPDPSRPFVLASASPRRRGLLALLGIPFEVCAPAIDETPRPGEAARACAERLAAEKALAAAAGPGTVVVAADTVVALDGAMLGKPADADGARRMLAALSGRTHEVVTGVCILLGGRQERFAVSTAVCFRAVEAHEIEAYVATGEPMDKAGAYAIQGGAAHMVRRIDGSYTNVVGLPLCELYQKLLSF